MLRRVARSRDAARGRYAALRPAAKMQQGTATESVAPGSTAPADAYASAATYLADTLEWLNLWQDNADNDCWNDEDFSAKQDQSFPQP